MKTLIPSLNPLKDIEAISYKGQDPKRKMYRPGYEYLFTEMPILESNDPLLAMKTNLSREVMETLGMKIRQDEWLEQNIPAKAEFLRTIVGMEQPISVSNLEGNFDHWQEGAEFVVAQWGDGFASPVHGHATGYMHEEVLFGKILVNTYRMTHLTSNVVRLVKTELIGPGTFVSQFAPHNIHNHFKRQALIHNFRSIGYSATLHYLPEHTRDGRDNQFVVQHFDEVFDYTKEDVKQLTAHEGLSLQIGDIAIVRSTNVAEYGVHYIVVTGAPVMKEHGLRPEEIVIEAPLASKILDQFEPIQGLTLLKLEGYVKEYFLHFHKITIENNQVKLPNT